MTTDLGALAAALAKAQTDFPTVTRDKTVTVQTKTGGSYSFKYAPLDSILNAVRQPLAANGLVIVQLLDDGALVTSLIHESGAILSGRIDLPGTTDIQGLGSAITYLRRYAIQGMLGIAAEDDDDGNRAAGNKTTQRPVGQHATPPDRPPLERRTGENGLVGKVATSGTQDYNLRETPDGMVLPFRVKEGNRAGQIVIAHGDLAEALAPLRESVIGQTVTVWGEFSDEESPPKADGFILRYTVLHLSRIQTPDFTLPAPEIVEAETVPLFAEDSDLSDLNYA
jgi:hypothetical protein